MDGLCLKTGIHGIPPLTSIGGTQEARCCAPHVTSHGKSTVAALSQKSASSRFSIRYSLKSLWPGGAENDKRCDKLDLNDGVLVESKEARRVDEENEIGYATSPSSLEGQSRNWIPKILRIKSLRSCETVAEEETVEKARNVSGEAHCVNDNSGDECDVCLVAEENTEQIELDRESFSRMLRKVSLAEAKLYAQISHLGNLAYSIPKIKAGNLLKLHGLRFVTSSLEKREVASKAKNNHTTVENQSAERDTNNKGVHEEPQSSGYERSASAAYQIATFATSYLHSHTKDLLPFKSSKAGYDVGSDCTGSKDRVEETTNSDVASHTANKDGVTSVVAAAEEVRQTVADDLNSILSSPCEWFSCDDDQSSTRFFIIQGSESLASWQANLLFEPTQFEGLDVHVHRGIYEAARGIYRQLLPEVRAHLRARGNHGHFRFSGHSLGGSLSLLISLMLLMRGEVPASCLLPIITFGSPSIMCGGDRLLHKLGLPRSHVQAIMMHRDIVPRAFSCHFPSHVYELLKAVNGNFRNHPCLDNQKLLYSPIGELLILQPAEEFSPEHHLLPCGSGLYVLSCPLSPTQNTEKQLQAAQMLFLNSPHPLEILSERSAYGSEGSIQRYHDMNSYLRCVRGVMREEQNRIRKERRERTRKMWQYLVLLAGINASMVLGRSVASFSMGQQGLNFSSILQTGKETLGSFSGLVASQCMHMLVLMLYHVKLLVSGIRSVISFN